MTLEHWLQTLRSTETYRSGVYSEAEYSIRWRVSAFKRTLPPVPRADADRHIIVIEVVGDAPVFSAALTLERPSIHVSAQDADRMLFIFVEMRPRPLDVSVDSGTYRLADDGEIGCQVRLEWRVTDAEAFWKGATDPVAGLRSKVVDTVRRYFSTLTTKSLEERAGVERDLADSIFDRTITIIKNGVETQISQHAAVPGARIDAVSAVIEPSELLTEHLRRVREQLYGQGGLIDRSKVDRMLEHDQTYAPYKVRDIARFLDMKLLENFYTRSWREAMAALAAAFEAKKAEHLPKNRLTVIEDALERAARAGLDEVHILGLKDKYAAALEESVEHPDSHLAITDQAFLMSVLGPPRTTAQLGFDASNGEDEKALE